ncbi:kinase-like protein [Sistotremastrum suecicum HHB10207 ss-3]|uniref:Kinase-like protein n=1 Tax=Sistotremastrum suecicum HHB10207 ss-3 TaxID=1314776 RepID=A0A166F088_9AGAM|nr:kinase-like protein [Sistotremastrum suecicum HHB10207 ss-3]
MYGGLGEIPRALLRMILLVRYPFKVLCYVDRSYSAIVAISYEPLKFIARSRLFNKVSGDVWICDWRTASLYPAANGRVSSQPVETYPGEETSMPTDRRLVIVKTFNTRSIDPHLTELIALSELKHRHISQIYDVFVGYDTSDVYVISEYAEGNLRSLIDTQNGRPLSLPVISSIFVQLANAIHHVHSLGWMHRNICPESVMVTPQGVGTYKTAKEVPLSDWDPVYLIQLANFEDCHYVDTYRSAPHRHGCKSHWYDAPEVLLSEERHSRAMDMWSLGALLVELVNLKPLFPGSGPFMQLYGLQSLLGGFEPDETTSESELHGGGTWQEGLDLSSHELPVLLTHKLRPKPMDELFHREVPLSMMKLTAQLLRYDPELRMTSAQCLDHPFTVDEFFKPLRLSVADLTGKVVKLGPFPIGYGGYGEVWRGKLHADDGSFQEVFPFYVFMLYSHGRGQGRYKTDEDGLPR